jgi:16S rRNA (guanine527-N7)-methyltransferase
MRPPRRSLSSPDLPRRPRSDGRSADHGDGARIVGGGKPGTGPVHDADLRRDRDAAFAMFELSSAAIARLDRFVDLLLSWQRRTNLIAPSTIPSLWTRHVADSLQLLDLVDAPLEKPRAWLDLGSGGGFPGVVIACALADAPGTQVHLVESNLKKAAFLREAVRVTRAPGIVHAMRIEEVARTLDAIRIDYVTARALAPLSDLLGMAAPFIKRGAKALFLKGQDLDRELTESTKRWHIGAESVPSRTSKAGRILIVHTLSPMDLSQGDNLFLASSGEQGGDAETSGSGRLKPERR